MQIHRSKKGQHTRTLQRQPNLEVERTAMRALLLSATFMLVIMLVYHLKPASRSLFIEYIGASRFPYAWIATALIMMGGIGYYQRLVVRYSRRAITWGTCVLACGLLGLLRVGMESPGPAVVAAFIVFVDILSVVLVEQVWSLANAVFTTAEGKRWYGVIGTGGLLGGIIGGAVSAALVAHTSMTTSDLLSAGMAVIAAIFILTWVMGRLGVYDGPERARPAAGTQTSGISRSRYFLLIASLLLIAQWIAPLIDYQFLQAVEINYPQLESRTVFLSMIAGLIGFVSVGINLVVTPIVHRYFGAIAGLLVQPTMIFISTAGFLFQSSALMASATKISDRALSYSINRASRELLYVPVDPILTYKAKAWIDMFGYRIFKVLGSVFILLVSYSNNLQAATAAMSWMSLILCLVWLWGIAALRRDYHALTIEEDTLAGADASPCRGNAAIPCSSSTVSHTAAPRRACAMEPCCTLC